LRSEGGEAEEFEAKTLWVSVLSQASLGCAFTERWSILLGRKGGERSHLEFAENQSALGLLKFAFQFFSSSLLLLERSRKW